MTRVSIAFLRRLVRQIAGTLLLLVDGHPVHRAMEMKNLMVKQNWRIRLFYLPGYSLELNPDELWN